jgi:hypothetical protein
MGEAPGERPLYAHCAICGAAIRWGDRLVTIARFEEQVREDGDVQVTGEDTLASLCAACGSRHPAAAIRLDLGGRSFRGTEGRGW